MVKKVIIEILLVPQSLDKPSDENEDEILKEFREGFLMIPWGYKIEKIKVVETQQIPEQQKTIGHYFLCVLACWIQFSLDDL